MKYLRCLRLAVLVYVCMLGTSMVRGQAVLEYQGAASQYNFGNYLTAVTTSAQSEVFEIAFDQAGDAFLLDAAGLPSCNRGPQIAKVTAAGNASIILPSCPANNTADMAADYAGNVYYLSLGAVKEISAAGASSTITTAVPSASAIASDAAGNLLVVSNGLAVYRIPVGGTAALLTIPASSLSGSVTYIIDSAFDSAGNAYLLLNDSTATLSQARVVEYTPGSTAASTVALGAYGLSQSANPTSLAVTTDGVIYIADTSNQSAPGAANFVYRIAAGTSEIAQFGNTVFMSPSKVRISPAGVLYVLDYDSSFSSSDFRYGQATLFAYTLDPPQRAVSLGSTAVGSSSAPLLATFRATGPLTVGTILFRLQGAATTEFGAPAATPGQCQTGLSMNTGDVCGLELQATPAATGFRLGSLAIADSGGNALSTVALSAGGTGPQVNYLTTSTSTLLAATAVVGGHTLNAPTGIAVDGSGTVYVADSGNQRLLKIAGGGVPAVVSLSPLTISGADTPVTIDGFGNVYVAGTTVGGGEGIAVVSPQGNVNPLSASNFGFSTISGLAIDLYGNLLISGRGSSGDQTVSVSPGGTATTLTSAIVTRSTALVTDGNGTVYVAGASQITELSASGSVSTVNGLSSVAAIAVDAGGDIFIGSGNTGALARVVAGTVTPLLGASAPASSIGGLARAANGDLYFTDAAANAVYRLSLGTPPSLNFAGTQTGATSADSPQSVQLLNVGTSALTAVPPGINVGSGFAQVAGTGTPADCTANFSLQPLAMCNLSISFMPVTTGTNLSSVTLTDNNLNASGATQIISLRGIGSTPQPVTPVIQWTTPAAIVYGTALSATQLDASAQYNGATVAGTFTYTPAAGTVLSAGANQTLSVTFVPSNTAMYAAPATQTTTITVTQATPILSWTTPAAIGYGTPLSGAQLNATATGTGGTALPGTFTYTPALQTVLGAGPQILSVSFVPTDSADYTGPVTKSVSLTVNKASATLAWSAPAAITYGTALSGPQLTATASGAGGAPLPGVFTYTPAAGTKLGAGIGQILSVSFVPTDTTDYNTPATTSTTITVNKAPVTLSWSAPSAITFGTALSSAQLNATALAVDGTSLPGTFTYTPAVGAVLGANAGQTLSVSFTPADTADYTSPATATTTLTVNKAAPVLSFPAPAAVAYGTPLSSTQLAATAKAVDGSALAGTFVYTPAAGTRLAAGANQTLSAIFTPADTADYTSGLQASTSITVNQASPALSWPAPADIVYGTSLSATQLDATAAAPDGTALAGTISYTPAAGVVLNAGHGQTLSAKFVPSDTADFVSPAFITTGINVRTAPLTVAAPSLSKIYGTANPVLTPGTITGEVTGDGITTSSSTLATAASPVISGGYAIVNTLADPNARLSNYSLTNTPGLLTITQAGTTTTLHASSVQITPGQSVTLTAAVASTTTGTPTGTVTFFDGTTSLGIQTLVSGTASLSVTLTAGSHTVTAQYGGDQNFSTSTTTSTPVTVIVAQLDFTLSSAGSSASAQTVQPGGVATYSFNIAPQYGSFPSTVSFSASGLPSGATFSFNPATLAASSTGSLVTLQIQTPALTGHARQSGGVSLLRGGTMLAGMLLPLAGMLLPLSRRRKTRTLSCFRTLGVAALAAGLLSAVGCGTGNGIFGQAPQTYNITVTAISGTLSHSTNVTLTVQ